MEKENLTPELRTLCKLKFYETRLIGQNNIHVDKNAIFWQ